MAEYRIINPEGKVINTIVADEAFAQFLRDTGKNDVVLVEPEPSDVPTPAEQREAAYNTEDIIEWDGEMLTVTQAAQKWQYYAAEGSPKAEELTALIAEAKRTIREKYPDTEASADGN